MSATPDVRTMRGLRLRTRLVLVFGALSLAGALGSAALVTGNARRSFGEALSGRLLAAARTSAALVDPARLAAVTDERDPYLSELRATLTRLTATHGLSWLALYRHNGEYFTHIADGAPPGDAFCLDYPILDEAEEMRTALGGAEAATDGYVDIYGCWRSAFVPVRGASGAVVAVVDAAMNDDLVAAFLEESHRDTVRAASLIALLVLAGGLFVARMIVAPLESVIRAFARQAEGDLTARADDGGGGEVGLLVDSFNATAARLAAQRAELDRRIFELAALLEVSRKVNHARDSQELLRLTLERALATLDAERGSVLLFSEETGMLSLATALGEGVPAAPVSRVELAPGEGFAGAVFAEREPRIANGGIAALFKPYDAPVEGECRNILCVPLLVEGRPFGVMNVVNRRSGGFTRADANLLETMASQVALTLEKARLYELAVTDGLTRLHDHRYFQLALEREMRRAVRYAKPLALLLLDIDHFKKFNDTYGHQIGDLVLVTTAALLRDTLRNVDLPARYGGEEFVAVLPETDAEGALLVAERVRRAIEGHDYPGLATPLHVTASIGVAAFPTHATEKQDLIGTADRALYAAKAGGRNRVVVADERAPGEAADHGT